MLHAWPRDLFALDMAGPSRTLIFLGPCLLLLFMLPTTKAAYASVASIVGEDDLADKLAQLIPNQYSLKQSDLPLVRPPPPYSKGWEMCDWSCLNSYTVKSGDRGQTFGVYEIEAV